MVISRTPLRISFVGGGSDLPSFCNKNMGAVVSTSIDKYMYVSLNVEFDHRMRISYSKTELCAHVDEIEHELVRESMKLLGVANGFEVTSVSDIPAEGTGLGSSSAYTVGLLNCFHKYMGDSYGKKTLAEEASVVEIEKCVKKIGRQDQYAVSYGGLNYIEFHADGEVRVFPIKMNKKTLSALNSRLLVFFTGVTRRANDILVKQSGSIEKDGKKRLIMIEMVDLAKKLYKDLSLGNIDTFGQYLHENWERKKRMYGGISSPVINKTYDDAINAGATGGKILGAGGGGFLLLYVPLKHQKKVISTLSKLRFFPVSFEAAGSKIIYQG